MHVQTHIHAYFCGKRAQGTAPGTENQNAVVLFFLNAFLFYVMQMQSFHLFA